MFFAGGGECTTALQRFVVEDLARRGVVMDPGFDLKLPFPPFTKSAHPYLEQQLTISNDNTIFCNPISFE